MPRLLTLLGCALAATVSFFAVRWVTAADTRGAAAKRDFGSGALFANLEDDGPLRPGVEIPYRDRAEALMVTVPMYRGVLDREEIATLISRGKAEGFEQRLRPRFRKVVAKAVRETEAQVREVSRQIREETALAQAEADRLGRDVWSVEAPRESAEFEAVEAQLLAVANPLLRRQEAVITSVNQGHKNRYYVLRRADYPAFFQLVDLRHRLIEERGEIVRGTVEELFGKHGMGTFGDGE